MSPAAWRAASSAPPRTTQPVDRLDQVPIALGDGQPARRRGRLTGRAASRTSSSERSVTPSAQAHDRLLEEHQAVAVERVADPLGPPQPGSRTCGRRVAGVEHEPVAAALLGVVQRDVRLRQKLAGVALRRRVRTSQARGGGRPHDVLADRHATLRTLRQRLGDDAAASGSVRLRMTPNSSSPRRPMASVARTRPHRVRPRARSSASPTATP